jgi:hypothetical protein
MITCTTFVGRSIVKEFVFFIHRRTDHGDHGDHGNVYIEKLPLAIPSDTLVLIQVRSLHCMNRLMQITRAK